MTQEQSTFTFEDLMQWLSLLILPAVAFIIVDAWDHIKIMPGIHKAVWMFMIIIVTGRALKLVSRLYKKAFNKAG